MKKEYSSRDYRDVNPVMPNYLISQSDRRFALRNYEGLITTYTQPENVFSNFGCWKV